MGYHCAAWYPDVFSTGLLQTTQHVVKKAHGFSSIFKATLGQNKELPMIPILQTICVFSKHGEARAYEERRKTGEPRMTAFWSPQNGAVQWRPTEKQNLEDFLCRLCHLHLYIHKSLISDAIECPQIWLRELLSVFLPGPAFLASFRSMHDRLRLTSSFHWTNLRVIPGVQCQGTSQRISCGVTTQENANPPIC